MNVLTIDGLKGEIMISAARVPLIPTPKGHDEGSFDGSTNGGSNGAVGYRAHLLKLDLPSDETNMNIRAEGLELSPKSLRSLRSSTMVQNLGHGGSSTIFEVSCSDLKQKLARKIIRRKQLSSSDALGYYALNSGIWIMKYLRHPHVVDLSTPKFSQINSYFLSPQ